MFPRRQQLFNKYWLLLFLIIHIQLKSQTFSSDSSILVSNGLILNFDSLAVSNISKKNLEQVVIENFVNFEETKFTGIYLQKTSNYSTVIVFDRNQEGNIISVLLATINPKNKLISSVYLLARTHEDKYVVNYSSYITIDTSIYINWEKFPIVENSSKSDIQKGVIKYRIDSSGNIYTNQSDYGIGEMAQLKETNGQDIFNQFVSNLNLIDFPFTIDQTFFNNIHLYEPFNDSIFLVYPYLNPLTYSLYLDADSVSIYPVGVFFIENSKFYYIIYLLDYYPENAIFRNLCLVVADSVGKIFQTEILSTFSTINGKAIWNKCTFNSSMDIRVYDAYSSRYEKYFINANGFMTKK